MAQFFEYPSPAGASQSQVQTAVTAALQAVLPTNLLKQDIHDASAATINAVGGAFVSFGAAVTIPAGTKSVQVSSILGEPVQVSFAVNVGGAAASVLQVYLTPGGGPVMLPFIPSTSNKAFIRSLSANTVTSGYVVLNFTG